MEPMRPVTRNDATGGLEDPIDPHGRSFALELGRARLTVA
jgi:hypothetical protein